jgi:hypothetical protein
MTDEGERLEFKSSLRYDYATKTPVNRELEFSVLKTIAAFANAKGGTLLIGVDNEKTVLGLTRDFETLNNPDHFQIHLRQIIEAQLGRAFSAACVDVTFATIDGLEVCRVDTLRLGEIQEDHVRKPDAQRIGAPPRPWR